jgi:CMP-2-keto-3-deoxyoctulosonic acid synthetase
VETIELQLDKQTLDRARWLAKSRHSSLSELIAEAINKLAVAEPPKDRILGMFADEPEVVDEILEEIMSDRAAQFEAR